ncbi:glycosyltransferase [Paenibacillus glycanilyticus]|uniref:glycosyltransferase family 2 protein n=1 Tax=Paenibacillus glycanilyticus TaxID=126569 RepID=UPI00203DA6FE|nr:glycosyltransferase [Paenibacillus glycanilyticus]MCM3626015.1 glycosyltransferase [Paenibacillus glycanilyticus]
MRSLARKRKIATSSKPASTRQRRRLHHSGNANKSRLVRNKGGRGLAASDNKSSGLPSEMAWRLGRKAAQDDPLAEGADAQQHVQEQWLRNSGLIRKTTAAGKQQAAMKAFLEGYFSVRRGESTPNWVLLPTHKKVAAVVMAMNEEQSIMSTIRELERLPLHEIIVVVNGSTDSSLMMARTSGKAVVLHYNEALGHDVGRAIGAKITNSDIVLFLDADIPISAEQLVPFVLAASRGVDVVLNDLSRHVGMFTDWDEVTIMKYFLNRSNNRDDLSVNSMTAIPHALTRKAIEIIGSANLAVPPKAQAIALQRGLRVGFGGSVNVFKRNRHRKDNVGMSNPISKLIMGDHLEALGWAMDEISPRLKYIDSRRDRVTGANKHNHPYL